MIYIYIKFPTHEKKQRSNYHVFLFDGLSMAG